MTSDDAYFYWPKGEVSQMSPHFKTNEFTCSCRLSACGPQKASKVLLLGLESVRAGIDAPMRVTSGFRCTGKQQELRAAGYETANGVSQHELGNAADIQADNMAQLLVEVNKVFHAVGVANTFIHVDTRPPHADGTPLKWSYQKA